MNYKRMYPRESRKIYIPHPKYWKLLFHLFSVKRFSSYPERIIYHERVAIHVWRLARRLYNLDVPNNKKLAEMGLTHDADEAGQKKDVTEAEKEAGQKAERTELANKFIVDLSLEKSLQTFDSAYTFEKHTNNANLPLEGFDENDLILRIFDITDGNILWYLSYTTSLKFGIKALTEKEKEELLEAQQYTIRHFENMARILGNRNITGTTKKILKQNLFGQWEVISDLVIKLNALKIECPEELNETVRKLRLILNNKIVEKKVWSIARVTFMALLATLATLSFWEALQSRKNFIIKRP